MGEKDKTVKTLVTVAVLIILAAVFISVIAEQSNQKTEKTVVTNEVLDISGAVLAGGTINDTYPLTITNYPTTWKIEDCPITNFVIGNATDDFTVTTDYTFTTTTGVLFLNNTEAVNTSNAGTNDSLVDYTYCADDYVNSSWGRSILDTNVGLYAIALLIAAVGLVYVLFGRKED